MSHCSLLIVGNCIVDQIWQIDHFPQEDDEFRAAARDRQLGGNAGNTARVLGRLGHPVQLLTQLADDDTARWLQQQLNADGVNSDLCPRSAGCLTPTSCIWLNRRNGSRTICHYRDLPELDLQQLQQIATVDYQWIHFEGRNIEVLLDYLSAVDIHAAPPLSLEIEKPRKHIERLLPYMHTVVVSGDYLRQRGIDADSCLQQFGAINPDLNMVCTLGSEGIVARQGRGDSFSMAAVSVPRVVDTIGAGDCFIAGLISSLARQQDFSEALVFANQLAASKIQHRGLNFAAQLNPSSLEHKSKPDHE